MPRPSRDSQLRAADVPMCEDHIVHMEAAMAAREGLPSQEMTLEMTHLFAALADPTRLRIVSALSKNELCVCDIAAAVGMSQSAVSHQLRILRQGGLVKNRRDGRLVYYALDDQHVVTMYEQALTHAGHTNASDTVS